MSNTYTQIHIQFVFAPKFRKALIHSSWKKELYLYMSGIVERNRHKLIAINGMPDHIHILIGCRPHQSASDLMQNLKRDSSKWINTKKLSSSKFEWQEGFGGFSYSKSQLKDVIKYIENQEKHHEKKTFIQEYLDFLDKFEVEYDERYIFHEPII